MPGAAAGRDGRRNLEHGNRAREWWNNVTGMCGWGIWVLGWRFVYGTWAARGMERGGPYEPRVFLERFADARSEDVSHRGTENTEDAQRRSKTENRNATGGPGC